MCVCVSVLCRNPNRWTDWNEIWHRGGPQEEEGSWGRGVSPVLSTPRCRVCKGGQGASGASGVCFGKNFIKQKLQEAPDLVGTGHLFGPQIRISKDLGPMSFWSHCHSLWRGINIIKVVVNVPHGYLMRLETQYPDPRGPGGLKRG